MFSKTILALAASALLNHSANAIAVKGTPEGFAAGVTGGGSAAAVYPKNIDELVSYLGDSKPRVVVLSKTFDFTGTEGTATEKGCSPFGTGAKCQDAINKNNWCTNYEPDAPVINVTFDQAGLRPIEVSSDKTILGEGNKGVLVGKGLRIANGHKNVIIQNIKIQNINPKHVWGGDAITLAGTDLVWIDHVTTSKIARQHLVLGNTASGRVTVTNSEFDGNVDYSATCDGYHYWNAYFAGSGDQITFKNNYLHHFSGRAPKINGNSVVHAVNNYWTDTSATGHGFEIDQGAYVLVEGNVFDSVKNVAQVGSGSQALVVTSSNAAQCKAALGRNCEANSFKSSGSFAKADTSFLSKFKGSKIAAAVPASKVTFNKAGYGTI